MIRIGTSGFSFPDWKGPVYPAGLKQAEWLPFCEREHGFNALEVNFSYYTLPTQKTLSGLSAKTSEGFKFVVKAFKGMTHEIRDQETGEWIDNRETFRQFLNGLDPLAQEKKLSCVLAQFPYGFFPNRENVGYLSRFKEELGTLPLVVEFRNEEWHRESVFRFLEERGIGYCTVDEPKIPKLMPYIPRVTTGIGYFRFHGRNPQWFKVPASVRYNYLYNEEELRSFLPDIETISKKVPETFLFFNNCYSGAAAKNAVQMAKLLSQAGIE
jgi:uncharacterized protein YecE (DUF72 family)